MYKYLIAIFPLLMLLFTGCKSSPKYRIGISQCSDDDWRRKMNDEIFRESMLHSDIEVEIRSANDSNDKQIADIQYFKDNGFDIIIAAPNEADAITPIITEVYDSGIPVIIFDRDINGDAYSARRVADNVGLGQAAAIYASNLCPNNCNAIEIYGLGGSTPAKGRHEGFNALADSLGINMLARAYGNWNYNDARCVADSLLAIYDNVDLIYAHNDRMAIAAADVADSLGRDIKIIGIDAAPEIGIQAVADGKIDATFLYPTEGDRLIKTALDILNGRPYIRDEVFPLSSAVDKTNADILLFQNRSIQAETSKFRSLKTQVDDYWSRHSAQTTLFYAVVAILVLLFGFLFMVLRAFWQHKRHQATLLEQNRLLEQQRDTERQLNEQLNEATQSKLMFFTNVSHDLRTPLTLIAEPIEQLVHADNLTPRQASMMKIADKNVKILHRLINQILDFRKYENGKLNLNLNEVKVAELIGDWSDAFRSISMKRHIKFTVDINFDPDFSISIDPEKIERVFFNLVSNAFKYTPDNGRISVIGRIADKTLVISVEDNGRGIAKEDIANIFDRFYQVDKIHPKGSGIGLSLAKAFVELHSGQIEVDSEIGRGSKFTISIPIRHTDKIENKPAQIIAPEEVSVELSDIEEDIPTATTNDNDERPLLLIIDDNSDIRLLIKELLSDDYRIIEAPDGAVGLRLASKYTPDIVICDVMMPVMDGMECCRRIKNELTTSHIPVLMLTACNMDEQRNEGYESGADGYLAKPFNDKMLRTRCLNLITNRKRIKNLWSTASVITTESATSPTNGDIDNDFYQRFVSLVQTEMGNPELNIDALAGRLGIGRSQFYRKIKALTNFSPVELLRKLRLEKARKLLASTNRSVSEIAYEVGFSSPAYFTRVYRESYGETPTELRERLDYKA